MAQCIPVGIQLKAGPLKSGIFFYFFDYATKEVKRYFLCKPHKKKGKVGQMCHQSCLPVYESSIQGCKEKSAVSRRSILLLRLHLTLLPFGITPYYLAHLLIMLTDTKSLPPVFYFMSDSAFSCVQTLAGLSPSLSSLFDKKRKQKGFRQANFKNCKYIFASSNNVLWKTFGIIAWVGRPGWALSETCQNSLDDFNSHTAIAMIILITDISVKRHST